MLELREHLTEDEPTKPLADAHHSMDASSSAREVKGADRRRQLDIEPAGSGRLR